PERSGLHPRGEHCTVIDTRPPYGADLQPAHCGLGSVQGRIVRPTVKTEIKMTTRTARSTRLVASAKTAPARKPLTTSHNTTSGTGARKGTTVGNGKAKVAKASAVLTTAQKLKSALDASAERDAKITAGTKARVKPAIRIDTVSITG